MKFRLSSVLAMTGALTALMASTLASPVAAATAHQVTVPPEDEASGRLKVPNGFAVRIFASGLNEPRLMAIGPNGVLYVAERKGNAIVSLPDANGDGVSEGRQVVAEGFEGPHSLEWFNGSLYVADNTSVTRLTDGNGDGDFADDGERTVIIDDVPTGGQHTSRTIHFGPDGMLYLSVGSSTNIGPETDPRRATILRYNADGSIPDDNPYATVTDTLRQPIWAEGLRNSIDFLFRPDGSLWANHNGSDMLGNNIPPEEIVIKVEKGKHYGWPYCYTPSQGRVRPNAADVRDRRVPFANGITNCRQSTPALFTDLAHSAPIGMAYYAPMTSATADTTSSPLSSPLTDTASGAAFPAGYAGNLFVAYHGSWNSTAPRDCKVQMVTLNNGVPVSAKPFLTGFRDNARQDCGDAWGRPAGVTVGPHGELFVSDDQNGNVYRIVYTGA